MKSSFLALFLLFSAFIPSIHADESASSDESIQAAPVIVPLSRIPQETVDRGPRDVDFEERQTEMRLSSEAKPVTPETSFAFQPQSVQQINAPKLFRSFAGIGASSFEPANPSIAVGPDRVVGVVNRSVAIFSKLGQKIFQTSLRAFFHQLPDAESVSIFPAKVVYDSYNQHFILVMEVLRPIDKRSWYFLAVSRTSSPEQDWAFWELNMSLNGGAPSGLYGDFPGIGVDQNAIYLTANMYNWLNRFQYAKIRVLKKSVVYSFGKLAWHDFFKLADASGAKAMSIQPVQSFGAAPPEYLVSSNPAGGKQLTLWTITSPTLPTIALRKKAVNVTAYELPPDAPQKGGPIKIGTGDCSLGNAVFRNGSVYTAHTISGAFGGNKVAAVRFYQIKTDGTVAQEVTYGAPGLFYYYPATMVDGNGNVVVVYNRSAAGQFVGIFFTGRRPTDAHNTLQPSAVLRPGFAYYHLTKRAVQYWGAYNGIALDYDNSIWMMGAYAKTVDQWGTRIGKVSY